MPEVPGEEFSFDDGASAVELTRDAVRTYVIKGHRTQLGSMREAFYVRTGVLVRLVGAGGRLRGCAGRWDATDHLGASIVDAAIDAASGESCGSEIERAELNSVRVSVCILGQPKTTEDPDHELAVGRDVAVVERGELKGWLYPSLPFEQGWSAAEYLDRTCRTAGLHPGEWADGGVTVSLVPGTVYRERVPAGEIERLETPDEQVV